MNLLRTALTELYGLFVDDNLLAGGILLWVAAATLLAPHLAGRSAWTGLALFGGLAALLVVDVVLGARK